MEEASRREEFLTLFKRLEKLLVGIADIRDGDYVSFSRALNKVYYDKLNPVISDYEIYSFLRSASDLRNLLSHENDVCVPTDAFIRKTERILERLEHPLSLFDICTKKVAFCSLDDSLSSVMRRMEELSLSHFPILESGKCIGVFSRSTLFDATLQGIRYDEASHIRDFLEVIGVSEHHNEAFLFVSKGTSTDKVFSYLANRKPHHKNIACIYVTEHGKKEEPLLGVCTLTDLTKIKD